MYRIITDSAMDLGKERALELDLTFVPYYISVDGSTYRKEETELPVRELYQFMVSNPERFPSTSLPSVADYYETFEKTAKAGEDLLCYTIPPSFSGSHNAARIAADMIRENYPGIRIEVEDSTMITLMFGAFMLELCRVRDMGMDYETLRRKGQEIKSSAHIFFTLENLEYLTHGGRAGKFLSASANTLNLRPLILMKNGELHSAGFSRGRVKARKKIIEKAVQHIRQNGDDPEVFTYMTGYGYDREEGYAFREAFRDALKTAYPGFEPQIEIGQIGATVGVHTGPHPIGIGLLKKIL